MSCSANAAPPVPWNGLTPATAADAAPGAKLTEVTAPSTDWAAVAVRPALVRPLTNRRREIECDRYWATSSRMVTLHPKDQRGAAAGLAAMAYSAPR